MPEPNAKCQMPNAKCQQSQWAVAVSAFSLHGPWGDVPQSAEQLVGTVCFLGYLGNYSPSTQGLGPTTSEPMTDDSFREMHYSRWCDLRASPDLASPRVDPSLAKQGLKGLPTHLPTYLPTYGTSLSQQTSAKFLRPHAAFFQCLYGLIRYGILLRGIRKGP